MNNQRSFIRLIVAYAAIYALMLIVGPKFFPQFFKPQSRPNPAQIAQQIQTQRDRAARDEHDALTGGNRLTISDRSQKWNDADPGLSRDREAGCHTTSPSTPSSSRRA